MAQYIDKDALVAEIEKLKGKVSDSSSYCNGWQHALRMLEIELNTLEVREVQEEPVSIDFEQELYKAFGQVKDFTLCMRIAKRFYDMGKKSRKPVSEDLKKAAEKYAFTMSGEDEVLKHDAFIEGAQWQKQKDSMPVSEDLEEEIIRYIGYPQEVDEDISTTMIRKAVRHFAKWQKTKDESISEDLGNYINELSKQFPEVSFAKLSRIAVRVAKWQKEQMMANTADVVIGLPYENKDGGYTHLVDVSRPLPVGNNKIAIIFEED